MKLYVCALQIRKKSSTAHMTKKKNVQHNNKLIPITIDGINEDLIKREFAKTSFALNI